MEPVLLLTVEEVLAIHDDQIERYGGSAGVRDTNLLESAVNAVAASFGGERLHTGLVEMAGAYLYYLVKDHPFVDGNKRVGAGAASVFLKMNGIELNATEPEFGDLVLAVAQGKADQAVVGEFIRAHIGEQ